MHEGNDERTVGVVTVGRSDFGIYLPILQALAARPTVDPALFVGGMHLAEAFGRTIDMVRASGFPIAETVDMLVGSDHPQGVAMSMGLGTIGFAQAYGRRRPDILLVLGDRSEMHAAVVAAVPFNIPIAHIHGGEETLGAMDNSFRHSISKMSHLHFVSTQLAARRLRCMGEDPGRIFVTGAPGVDTLRAVPVMDRAEFARRLGLPPDAPFRLVTYHPPTVGPQDIAQQVGTLLDGLRADGMAALFTLANADPGGALVNRMIRAAVDETPSFFLAGNLGTELYVAAMRHAEAMVGNSSSGIIEAASFALPVVNIGDRQAGRERSANVIDVACTAKGIAGGLRRAATQAFRQRARRAKNIYGDGHAAQRIADILATVHLDVSLLRKPFNWVSDPPSRDGTAVGGGG